MKILETARLTLRHVTLDDAAFYLRLVNEPAWLQYIGDKGVRTLADARAAIVQGPIEMQTRLGFSLYLCELKGSGVSIGLCGLIQRDGLDAVDIGFAFLPEYWGRGYACEAATAVVDYAGRKLGLRRLLAVTASDNASSIRLIERLGLRLEGQVRLRLDSDDVQLYSRTLAPS